MIFVVTTFIAIILVLFSVLFFSFLPRITGSKTKPGKTTPKASPSMINLLRTLAIFVILAVVYGVMLHKSEKDVPESGKGISTSNTSIKIKPSTKPVSKRTYIDPDAELLTPSTRLTTPPKTRDEQAGSSKVLFKGLYEPELSIARPKPVEDLTVWEKALKDTAFMFLSLSDKIKMSSFDEMEFSFRKKDIPSLVVRLSLVMYLIGLLIMLPFIKAKHKTSLFSLSSVTIIFCITISVSALFYGSVTSGTSFWTKVSLCNNLGALFCFLAGLLSVLSAASFTSNSTNNTIISGLFRFLRYKSHFIIYPLITLSAALYSPSYLVFISFVTINMLILILIFGNKHPH